MGSERQNLRSCSMFMTKAGPISLLKRVAEFIHRSCIASTVTSTSSSATSQCVTIRIDIQSRWQEFLSLLARAYLCGCLSCPEMSKITMLVTTFSTSIAIPESPRALRPAAGVLVVFVQAFRSFFEGDQACGGEDSDLTHSAAEAFSPDAGLLDEIPCPEQYRARRCAEAFRQREHYRVAMTRKIGDRHVQGDGRVEYSGTVHMHRQPDARELFRRFRTCSAVITLPPAKLCVFSRQIRPVGAT